MCNVAATINLRYQTVVIALRTSVRKLNTTKYRFYLHAACGQESAFDTTCRNKNNTILYVIRAGACQLSHLINISKFASVLERNKRERKQSNVNMLIGKK
jgi:hypothetical protein